MLVGFSTRRHWNPLSWAIRSITKSRCSHCFVAFEDPVLGQLVLEATEWGTRVVSYPWFMTKNKVVAWFDPGVDLTPGIERASALLGTWYNFLGLFGMVAVMVGRVFKKRWKNPLMAQPAADMFCSELVCNVLQWSGMASAAGLEPDEVSPEDMLLFFESLKGR
jgi:hypothetical protein